MYGSTQVTDVPITMSDGVTLIADVGYPTDLITGRRAAGTFPVLLNQNPYFCFKPDATVPGAYFVTRGYIFVKVCLRGSGRSGGNFEYFGTGRVAEDGKEMVYWAADRLDGSNGVVGLTGCSFHAFTQLFTVALLPKNSPVKAMAPFCAGAEQYREANMAQGIATQTANLHATYFYVSIGAQGGAWGNREFTGIANGADEAYYRDYWKRVTPGIHAARIVKADIPALLWSGWADQYALGSQELYTYFQNAYFGRPVYSPMEPGSRTTGRYQIVVGPWGHGGGINLDIQLEWFDTWLKGQDTRMADTGTPMHLWDLTAKHWVNTASFPLTQDYTPYYLGPAGTFTSRPPTATGSNSVTWAQPIAAGSTLIYTSEPLAQGATLAGPIGARLYASSSSTNLELIATLFDVAPGGEATKLTSGFVVGSLAAQDLSRAWYDERGNPIRTYGLFDKDRYLTPGKVKAFDFWISPRLATIAPGHALRLVLTTQAPQSACSAPAGVDPCYPNTPQKLSLPGTYNVFYSPSTPSLINLPLLPLDFFKSTGTGPIPLDWGKPGCDDDGDDRDARRGDRRDIGSDCSD
jgi:predicted acyl esterase